MLHEMGYETGIDLGSRGRGGARGAGRAGPPAGEPRAHRGAGRVAARLALAVATGAASVLPGFLVGALALQIRGDLDVRVEAVAAGVTVFFLAGALGAGWGGRLADHIGAVRAMRRCVLVTAGCAGRGGSGAVARRCCSRCWRWPGWRTRSHSRRSTCIVAERIPPDRQGLGFGIKQSGIPAAILVSGLALPVLALPLGWRADFRAVRAGSACGGVGAADGRGRARVAADRVSPPLACAAPHRARARRSPQPGRARWARTSSPLPSTSGSARARPACWPRSRVA